MHKKTFSGIEQRIVLTKLLLASYRTVRASTLLSTLLVKVAHKHHTIQHTVPGTTVSTLTTTRKTILNQSTCKIFSKINCAREGIYSIIHQSIRRSIHPIKTRSIYDGGPGRMETSFHPVLSSTKIFSYSFSLCRKEITGLSYSQT